VGKERSRDVQDVTDGWGGDAEPDDASSRPHRAEPRASTSAFGSEDSYGRKVTLTLSAPPLALPEDEEHGSAAQRGTPVPIEPRNYDAWNADRLKRASLPPTSTLPPSAPTTPLPSQEPPPLPFGEDDDGDAFALVSRSTSTTPAFDLVAEMAERFSLGDFSGSLRAAELILGRDPEHGLAQHYARETHHKLEVLYCSRLDAQGRIPELAVAENEVRWLGLDPQVGHLLARIDGMLDYEQVVQASGMPRLAALRTLVELVDGRVVRLM
jgi:hypothetical protein